MKKMLSAIVGPVIALFGFALIALGAYTGIWIMLIGGIVDIIEQIKLPAVDSMVIAIAVAKIIFCQVPMWGLAWLGIITMALGATLIQDHKFRYRGGKYGSRF
jgi:hypothetical protein